MELKELKELRKKEKILRQNFHKIERHERKVPTMEVVELVCLDMIMDMSALIRLLIDKKVLSSREVLEYKIKIFKDHRDKKNGFED